MCLRWQIGQTERKRIRVTSSSHLVATTSEKPRDFQAELSFSVETAVDFEDTAKIANASFGFKRSRFSAALLRWLYGQAFGADTTVVVARHAGEKIGQANILWHPISIDGASHRGAQLIDLFVAPECRSYEVVAGIYSSLRDQLKAQENCVVVTLPNDKATVFNKRFLKLRNGANLQACVGIAVPRRGQVRSAWVSSICADDAVALMRSGIPAYRGIAVEWTPQRLLDRLSNPGRRYAVHPAIIDPWLAGHALRQMRFQRCPCLVRQPEQ
jgi:hypothetical protein